MKLSIIMPAINPEKWENYYQSLLGSYSGDFELIILGPNEPLVFHKEIIFIKDNGRPSRRFQRGLLRSTGEYIMFSFDDAIFYPGMIDKAFELHDGDEKTVVSCKYLESELEISKQIMIKDDYYTIHYHEPLVSDNIPLHFCLWQTGLAKRSLIMNLGGIDCRYEAMPMAVQADLAVRMQWYGCRFVAQQGFMLKCGWTPDREHHAPTQATWEHDIPLFQMLNYKYPGRTTVDVNNWTLTSENWERRNKPIDKHDPKFHWTLISEHSRVFWDDVIIINELLSKVKGNIFVEFGAFVGGFTSNIAKIAKERNGKVYSIDMFDKLPVGLDHWDLHTKYPVKNIFIENMKELNLMDVIEVIQGFSWEVASQFEDESIDFVWVDGDHHYDAVIKDIKSWYPKLKKGGIIGGHDYSDKGVEMAVKEYFKEFTIHKSNNICWSKEKI